MTVQNNLNKHIYIGDGETTEFPYTFILHHESHMKVYVVDLEGNETLLEGNYEVDMYHYKVIYPLSGDPLPPGYKLILYREVPVTQEMDLTNQGALPNETLERAYDKLTLIAQQHDEAIKRSLKASLAHPGGVFDWPAPAPGKVVGWNADGTGMANYDNPGEASRIAREAADRAEAAAATVADATYEATPNTLIRRDANGRAKVAAPEEEDDIARKAEVDAHKADKVTDATKNPHGAFTEFADRAVNVKWFGAVGDGVTDDTQAIQDALSSLGGSGGLVFFPAGTYLFNETLVIGRGQTIAGVGSYNGSILLYTGSGSAVDIGTDGCLSKIVVRKDPSLWTGDWNLANPVSGVRLTGSRGRAEDIVIIGFEIGLHLIGEGVGCAYNQVFLRQIYNCHKAIVLDATTVGGAMGWVNENTIYGGSIDIQSSYRQTPFHSTTWGIYMDCHTTHFPNNNKFIGLSIEGVNNGMRIVGMYNTFLDPRIEIPGTVKIVFQNLEDSGDCRYNWIFGLYGTYTLGTNVLVKNVDDTDNDYLRDNMIIGRSVGNLPLQMTNDSLSFLPSYRKAIIKYNVNDYCFEFWHEGNKIATLDRYGNLKTKGTVSGNQTL